MITPEVRIVAPADPGEAVFDPDGMPFLTFGPHAEHGEGWTLWYLGGNGEPEDHFIPGEVTDEGWALDQARGWLNLIQHSMRGRG